MFSFCQKKLNILNLKSKDLGCVKTVKIEREDLATTEWDAGLMFVWENWTGGGCWSGLGQISGYSNKVFTSMTETGSPPGWQIIAMAEDCGGGTAPTVHHEVLHALGVGHEHNRPDRNADTFMARYNYPGIDFY